MTSDSEIVPYHETPDVSTLQTTNVDIPCEEGCGKIFANSSAMKLHARMVHLKSTKIKVAKKINIFYHCPEEKCIYNQCTGKNAKYFSKLKYLKQHYLKVHAEKTHCCSSCAKRFSTKALLSAHQIYCGVNLECCCGQKFSMLESLQTHIRRNKHTILETTQLELRAKRLANGFNQNKKNNLKSGIPQKILPKINTSGNQQPSHMLAAVALMELAGNMLKRVAYADAGVQVDLEPTEKQIKKTILMTKSLQLKPKCSAETQTRLTRKENTSKSQEAKKSNFTCDKTTKNNFINNCIIMDNLYTSNITVNEDNYDTMSTLGTQTKLSGEINILTPTFEEFDINFLKETSNENNNSSNDHINEVKFKNDSNSRDFDRFKDSPVFMEDDLDDLNTEGFSYSRKMSPFTEISSLSIETQTDHYGLINENISAVENDINLTNIETQTEHDVLLCKNAESTVDHYDTELTNNETQTDMDVFLGRLNENLDSFHSKDNPWCTIETQTCEDFSDIEQYLCSSIHTQTPDEAGSELFPELSFTDMQTQTRLDDLPLLVDTHTQTSLL